MAEKKTASRAEQAGSGAKKKTSSGSASKPSGKEYACQEHQVQDGI